MEYLFLRNAQVYQELVLSRMLKVRRSLWIATALLKDMHVEHGRRYRSVLREFREMTARGVEVRILHAGVPGERYRHSLTEAGLVGTPGFTMRRCVRVHFKCVLGDDAWLFLGSPNLTGAGMGAKGEARRNFELGILTTDPSLREHVKTLFLDVWDGRACTSCGRKRYCPVPLEEPDF